MMKHPFSLLAIFGILISTATADDETTFKLARELLTEKEYSLAAIEFRRFAMENEQPAEKAAAYLYSGYAYLQANKTASADEMLDRAENADQASQYAVEWTLLNAESARLAKDPDTAMYYYDVLAADTDQAAFQTFARRRAAAIHLASGDLSAARQNLAHSAMDETLSKEALENYSQGKDKKPFVGGLLGLIPGAGYWYSGETANGFRSLILNALFIYGMIDTAQDDQWGAFAIITFFEITWYSGSIYGGIDAAHRYNKNRLDSALQVIENDMSYAPDPEIVMPIFKLNILF